MGILKKITQILLLIGLLFVVSCGDESVDFIYEEEIETPPVDTNPNPSGTLTAKEIIIEMGAGFNLGNTFENRNNIATLTSVKPIIDLYHNAGMKHIRIPVTWMDRFSDNNHLADANGTINYQHTRFKELVKVIDYALSIDMYVVLNTHHEHWLKDNYDGTASFDTKFRNLWSNIATYFKDYSPKLVFEVLNEPEGNLGELGGSWPEPTSTIALTNVRKVNKVGYDAIRAAGGTNETRLVMVATNAHGDETMIEEVYPSKATLPGNGSDLFLAIQVHSYNPWSFCGHTGSNSAFPGSTSIANAIKKVGTHSKVLDVPVNYGEFGVGRETNTAERNTDLVRGYYKTFADTALGQNMSYSVWDDRGWFGLVNSGGSSFTYNIVPVMLGN